MKREFMEKWVAALRSGKFRQAKECLYDGNGYCCLGVAEIVAGSVFEDIKGNEGHRFSIYDENAEDNEDEFYNVRQDIQLTMATEAYAGMRSANGTPDDGGKIKVGNEEYEALDRANDAGRTFSEIADAIEANWERL